MAVSLVDLASGSTLAASCHHPGYDVIVSGALSSAVLRHKLRLVRAFSPKVSLDDMLITVGTQLHMIRMVALDRLLYVVADGTVTHFAAMRAVVSEQVGADG